MKYNLCVTRNVVPDEHRPAWLYLVEMIESRKNVKSADLIEFAEKVHQQFPDLPNKMVWGNYLIPDIDENFVLFDIDFPQVDEIISCIRKLAKDYSLVVFDGKQDKIYRPN